MEREENKGYPDCLLIRRPEESKPCLKPKTEKLRSSLLPELKSFLSKVSQEKSKPKEDKGDQEDKEENCDQQPQIELSIAFYELSKGATAADNLSTKSSSSEDLSGLSSDEEPS